MKFLIVGQGLAGSILGLTLLKRGHTIKVVDRAEAITSSKVAAGIFNPITGMNRSKTWKAEELFPFLKTFYGGLVKELGVNFYKEMPIYMPFGSLESQNEWYAKSSESYWKQWMHISEQDALFKGVIRPYGGMETLQSGWLDTRLFVDTVASFLKQQNLLEISEFDASGLLLDTQVHYAGQQYDNIIFCNGLGAAKDPLFSWLNHAHVKGDLFEVSIPEVPHSHIINKNGFALPIANGQFKVGSTYNNFFEDSVSATKEGYALLEEKLMNIVDVAYTVNQHYAATRPATKDRRPLLGRHPKYNNVLIFNGLGTKGVSLAPYLASHLVDYIENRTQLLEEVNIERCLKYYKSEHQNV